MAKKKKYYVVWKGQKPGVYDNWADCQSQIIAYPNALYKSFPSKAEAEAAYSKGISGFSPSGKSKTSDRKNVSKSEIRWNSLSVDAACSGNPGVMEYQGVDTKSKRQIFHKKFQLGTNNIGEFLALVHALALLKKSNNKMPIYTDSGTAMAWVRNKKVKTTLKKTASTAELFELIERAETWLKNNSWENPILKWNTKSWGEIPADFGRK